MNFENRKVNDVVDFELEINEALLFVLEVCGSSFAFCTYNDLNGNQSATAVGIEFSNIPQEILHYNQNVITKKEMLVIKDISADAAYLSNDDHSIVPKFIFFVGFPIINQESNVVGSFCIVDLESKLLSNMQLKAIEYVVKQIEFKLKAFNQVTILLDQVTEKENQFQLLVDNSKEIYLELDADGVIGFTCNLWTAYLGFDADHVIGKNFFTFLHPEYKESVKIFLNEIIADEQKENNITYQILHQEDYFKWFTSSFRRLFKNGKWIYIGNCRDVTDQIITQTLNIQNKEFYEKILDQIPTDIAVFDKNHRYLYLNKAAIKDDELREFIIGKDDLEYAKHTGREDDLAKPRRKMFLQAMESKTIVHWEDKNISPFSGLTSYHDRKLNPVFDQNGDFQMMVGFGVDITKSRIQQQEILKDKQLLRSILENIAVGILIQGPQSEIIESNEAASEILGFTKDQLIGKTSYDKLWEVIHLDGTIFDTEELAVPMAIKLMKPVKNVVMGVKSPKSIGTVWLLVDAIPVIDNLGSLQNVVCSFKDITSLKKIEDDLKISNERFLYLSEATSDALWDWNIALDEIFVGVSYLEMFGYQNTNSVFKSAEFSSLVHPDDSADLFQKIDIALKNPATKKWRAEYRYAKANGQYAYVNDKAIIIRDDSGIAIRMIGGMQDVTKKKELEDELRKSEEHFKEAFEYSPVGIALIDVNGFYVEVNERYCEILGYSIQEMYTLTFQEITYPEDLVFDLQYKESLDLGEISHFSTEKRFIHKNGSIVWAYISVSLVKNSEDDFYYISQLIDITARKNVEIENNLLIEENNKNKAILLDEAKNRYRFLAENAVDLICIHDLDLKFQYVSPSAINILGYGSEEMLGKFASDFAHEDDVENLKTSLEKFLLEENIENFTARYKTSSGNYIWLETKANIIEENGVKVGFQSSSRDITIRKEQEQATENALAKERELNELRTNLVSTISHEFRTPMTTIRTSAELIAMYVEGQNFEKIARVEKQIKTITGEIDRIVELMNSVLTISKNDAGKTNFNPVIFDLKQLCIKVIETSFDTQKDGSKVQTYFKGDSFPVFADKNLMEYSIFNILNNAFKYSQGCGDVVAKLSATRSNVILQIIDKGIGIPIEDQPKLFNTFFRASNTEGIQGTGLGLCIVKTFTERNGGSIKLQSYPGIGTEVTLKFALKNSELKPVVTSI